MSHSLPHAEREVIIRLRFQRGEKQTSTAERIRSDLAGTVVPAHRPSVQDPVTAVTQPRNATSGLVVCCLTHVRSLEQPPGMQELSGRTGPA